MKFQVDMLNFCDLIQVSVFTTNHHLKRKKKTKSKGHDCKIKEGGAIILVSTKYTQCYEVSSKYSKQLPSYGQL